MKKNVYKYMVGQPSWHQQKAGHTCSAIVFASHTEDEHKKYIDTCGRVTFVQCEVISHSDIRIILGRVHVATRILPVVRLVINSLKGKRKKFLKMPKWNRRYIIACIIQTHMINYAEYRNVMGSSANWREYKYRYYIDTTCDDSKPKEKILIIK